MFFLKGNDEILQPCHDSSPSFFWFRKGNDEIPQVLLGRGLEAQHVFVMIPEHVLSPQPLFFGAQPDLAGPSTATSTVAPMRGPAQTFSGPCLGAQNTPNPRQSLSQQGSAKATDFSVARSLLPGFTHRDPTPLLHMATNIQNLN